MPYFVYYLTTLPGSGKKSLQHVQTFDKFKDARTLARTERAKLDLASGKDCRLIFARNQVEAEKLLSAPREERVVGED